MRARSCAVAVVALAACHRTTAPPVHPAEAAPAQRDQPTESDHVETAPKSRPTFAAAPSKAAADELRQALKAAMPALMLCNAHAYRGMVDLQIEVRTDGSVKVVRFGRRRTGERRVDACIVAELERIALTPPSQPFGTSFSASID